MFESDGAEATAVHGPSGPQREQWRLKRRRPETEGGKVSRRVLQVHARSASPTFGVVSRRVCLVAPLCGSTHSECLVLERVSFWNLLLYVFPLDGVSMLCHGAG